jgi:hypothetical protein
VRQIRQFIVVALIPIATLAMTAAAAAPTARAGAAHGAGHSISALAAGSHAKSENPAVPRMRRGTPTGCPTYNLCTYLSYGDGQGAGDICFYRSGDVTNWSAITGPQNNNCHKHSGALVNAHTTGAVELWEGKEYGGEMACINHGSYFEDTRYNYYPPPNNDKLQNNIDSSKQNTSLSC